MSQSTTTTPRLTCVNVNQIRISRLKLSAMSQWSEATINQFAESFRNRRKALGMSAQAVADRTTELGHPIGRSAIAAWENGSRGDRLLLADALVLAYVVGVPLGLLLYPNQPDGEVNITPDNPVDAFSALGWLTGEVIPHAPADESGDNFTTIMVSGTELYTNAQQLMTLRETLGNYEDDYRAAVANQDVELASQLQSMIRKQRAMIDFVAEDVRQLGGEVNG